MTNGAASAFHNWAQGIFAIVGAAALILGGALYLWERRDKPRVILQPNATVTAISRTNRRGRRTPDYVLLQVAINIENRGERGRWFNCAAIDIIGLRGIEGRANPYPDDLAGPSLLSPPAANDPLWLNCVGGFEATRRKQEASQREARSQAADSVNPPAPTSPPPSGARYRDFFMEPGEITTKTWEQVVPCSYNAVRVIFKLPKPGSPEDYPQDYETKILVPIADVCRGERIVATYPVDRD